MAGRDGSAHKQYGQMADHGSSECHAAVFPIAQAVIRRSGLDSLGNGNGSLILASLGDGPFGAHAVILEFDNESVRPTQAKSKAADKSAAWARRTAPRRFRWFG